MPFMKVNQVNAGSIIAYLQSSKLYLQDAEMQIKISEQIPAEKLFSAHSDFVILQKLWSELQTLSMNLSERCELLQSLEHFNLLLQISDTSENNGE